MGMDRGKGRWVRIFEACVRSCANCKADLPEIQPTPWKQSVCIGTRSYFSRERSYEPACHAKAHIVHAFEMVNPIAKWAAENSWR